MRDNHNYDTLGYTTHAGWYRTRIDVTGLRDADWARGDVWGWDVYSSRRMYRHQLRRYLGQVAHLSAPPAGPTDFRAQTAAQHAPFYTNRWPSSLAPVASYALTCAAEYRKRLPDGLVRALAAPYLREPARQDRVMVVGHIYQFLAADAARHVESRVIAEVLKREAGLDIISYGLSFLACLTGPPPSVRDILQLVVLSGDRLPRTGRLGFQAFTERMVEHFLFTSGPFYDHLATVPDATSLPRIGVEWLRTLMRAAAQYLPAQGEPQTVRRPAAGEGEGGGGGGESSASSADGEAAPDDFSYGDEPGPMPDVLPPLDQPRPPGLGLPLANDAAGVRAAVQPEGGTETELGKALSDLAQALGASEGTTRDGHRSDLIEGAALSAGLDEGPISGGDAEGVIVELDDREGGEGGSHEVFEVDVEPVASDVDIDDLIAQAQPLYDAIKGATFPSLRNLDTHKPRQTSGRLDARRLPYFQFENKLYRKPLRTTRPGPGRILLMLVMDLSGSINPPQVLAAKRVATAWLLLAQRRRIRVGAAAYHDNRVPGLDTSGAVLHWLHRPSEPLVLREAVRRIRSGPDNGSGNQSDAASIKRAIATATAASPTAPIFLIHLSDYQWGKSFRGSDLNPKNEMRKVIGDARGRLGERLHVAHIGLRDGGEDVADLYDSQTNLGPAVIKDDAAMAQQMTELVTRLVDGHRKGGAP